ncbi:MAG TPA: hypothetical protein VK882_00840 [Nitrososphaeraceae archaeon]|jgi:hypothetical protein|nr:hypothetical protein [Nitrososphaeraceae archaeon]
MDSKLNSIVITSILAFTLIAGIIPIAFVNVIAQGEGGDTGGMIGSGGEGDNGMSMDNSTMMNATLAYAQGEEGEDISGMTEGEDTGMTEGLGNDTGMTEGEDTGGMTEGQSEDNGGDEENKDNGN